MQVIAESQAPGSSLVTRVAAAWFLGLVALTASGWTGEQLVEAYGIAPQLRYGIQAVMMSALVVFGVWWLRRTVDRRPFAGLQMLGFTRSLKGFGLGSGLILVPTIVTFVCTALFGWASFGINPAPGATTAIVVGTLTAFFFEALPEELLFRGYIYRNLNTAMRRWTAGLATILLFTLLPVGVVAVQSNLLGMEIQIGPSDHITASYLLTMFLFATFLQYLRVLTGSVWPGIGFHLFFLMSNRIVGVRESSFIQLSNVTANSSGMQLVMMGGMLTVFAAILRYPRVKGMSMEWGKVDPERGRAPGGGVVAPAPGTT